MMMSFRFFDRYSFNKLLTVLIRWQNYRNTIMNLSILFKKSFQHTALVSAVTLAAFGVSNSFADQTNATSTAVVIAPIAITKDVDLNFGQFAPGAGGNVTVSTADGRATSGPILSTTGDATTSAQFTVAGADSATFTVGITNTPLSDVEGAAEDMTLTTFSDIDGDSATGSGDEVTSGTLSSDEGELTIYLGGILAVGASQAAGDYAGSVTTTVQYN
jgi:hypothetical protein